MAALRAVAKAALLVSEMAVKLVVLLVVLLVVQWANKMGFEWENGKAYPTVVLKAAS